MKRTLGRSGLEVSALGMGCWAIGGPWNWIGPGEEPMPAGWGQIDDDESIRAIHAALDAGITLFDTAANYGAGHSESILARALKGRRADVVIATKFGHMVDEDRKRVHADDSQILANVRTDVENSLRRLETDTIDIYQLHAWDYDREKALELREVLEDLVQAGKIRWYGWSTDLVDHARIFAEGEHCSEIQFIINALHDNPDMRRLCAEFDMAGLIRDPLNRGILTGKFTSESTFPDDDVRSRADFTHERMVRRLAIVEALREVLTSGGRTMAQGALSYILGLDERLIPIPGFKTVEQVKENASTMAFGSLTPQEMQQVQQIVEDHSQP
jgi:aryl-alcohol dehydrogenase-like predicted oxidoreductase